MAHLEVRDGDGAEKHIKATGAGTVGDPFILERTDTNSAAMLTALQAIQTAVEILDNIVSGSEAQVDIVTSALPTGAATATNQSTANTALSAIQTAVETLDNIVSGTEAQVDVVTVPADPFGADADAAATAGGTGSMQAKLRLMTTQLDAIQTAVEILDNAISGTEMQADIVAALPAGDNNIGNVDIASALPAGTNNIGDVDVATIAAGTNVIGKTQPFAAVTELGVTELIGINEQVDTNDYSASEGVALGGTYSGELLSFMLMSTEDGTGAVLEPTGQLLIFDTDPSIANGATDISAAVRATIIGVVDVAADDWLQSDANGATAMVLTDPIPFHGVSTLYFAWFHTLATSYNDAAGDDEQLEVNAWFRRDS